MPTICVHKLALCFCSKNLVSLFLAWVVPSVNVRQATAQVGLSPVQFAVENNFCTAGRTSMSVLPSMPPVVWTAPGVPTLGVSPVVLVWDAGIVRQGAALHSIGVVETLATPGVGKKKRCPATATTHHYRDRFALHTRTTTTHSTIHYFRPLPIPLPFPNCAITATHHDDDKKPRAPWKINWGPAQKLDNPVKTQWRAPKT